MREAVTHGTVVSWTGADKIDLQVSRSKVVHGCLCPVLAWFRHLGGPRGGPVAESREEELEEGQASTERTRIHFCSAGETAQ